VLYGLHRRSYQKVIKNYEQRVKKQRLNLLKSIPLFTQGKLTNKDLLKLVDALEAEVFEFGATVLRQGDAKKKVTGASFVVAVVGHLVNPWLLLLFLFLLLLLLLVVVVVVCVRLYSFAAVFAVVHCDKWDGCGRRARPAIVVGGGSVWRAG
jgi:preprotein translocase subunit SecF